LLAVEDAFCQLKSYVPDQLGLLPLFSQPPAWAEA
jgi:hypothetical protein